MNMPESRRRWFNGTISLNWRPGLLPCPGINRLQSPTDAQEPCVEDPTESDQDHWPDSSTATRLGTLYAVSLASDCPAQLLEALEPGDLLELVPDVTLHEATAVRIDYGIFQVGHIDCSQRSLLWRLLTKGFNLFGRVAKIEQTTTGQALWINIYLGE